MGLNLKIIAGNIIALGAITGVFAGLLVSAITGIFLIRLTYRKLIF